MRIQHNISAMNSHRQLGVNNSQTAKNLEKLSSGYRINRAGDDAAGLAISEKMRSQIRGLETAQKNSQDGISLVQTAEGALTEVHSMLNRMVELATQASNGTYTTADRTKIDEEMNKLTEEIDRIAEHTNFNGKKLLNGDLAGAANAMSLQVGDTSLQVVTVDIGEMDSASLGLGNTIVDNTGELAKAQIDVINKAVEKVSVSRSGLGAVQNRLEHTINNLGVTTENLQAAEGRIRDVDMASEMMNFTKNNILSQAAQAMLAQANQQPQGVLQLLR